MECRQSEDKTTSSECLNIFCSRDIYQMMSFLDQETVLLSLVVIVVLILVERVVLTLTVKTVWFLMEIIVWMEEVELLTWWNIVNITVLTISRQWTECLRKFSAFARESRVTTEPVLSYTAVTGFLNVGKHIPCKYQSVGLLIASLFSLTSNHLRNLVLKCSLIVVIGWLGIHTQKKWSYIFEAPLFMVTDFF